MKRLVGRFGNSGSCRTVVLAGVASFLALQEVAAVLTLRPHVHPGSTGPHVSQVHLGGGGAVAAALLDDISPPPTSEPSVRLFEGKTISLVPAGGLDSSGSDDTTLFDGSYDSPAQAREELLRRVTARLGRPNDSEKVTAAIESVVAATYSARSDTATNGIQVSARSWYSAPGSQPSKNMWSFMYVVRITNHTPHPIKLVSRQWEVKTVEQDNVSNLWTVPPGLGVHGETPIIQPGQSFEYTSHAPLHIAPEEHRVAGRMHGTYRFQVVDATGQPADVGGAGVMEAKVAPFHFIVPQEAYNRYQQQLRGRELGALVFPHRSIALAPSPSAGQLAGRVGAPTIFGRPE